MSWLDKIKSAFSFGAGVAAAPINPVSAVANAVGNVAGAVKAGEELADHTKLLHAGQAEGVEADAAKTEERVAAAGAAHGDQQLRNSVEATRFRD
jgi:hypothetical protein